MPEMTPVANQVRGPDPNQTLTTLSGILGMKQAQQNIALQKQQVAQQTLETQKAQGVQSFFSAFKPSEHIGPDGTVDIDSAMELPEFKNAGNAKPGIMQGMLDIKNKQLTAKTSLAALDDDLLSQFAQQTGALAEDEDVKADAIDPKTGVNLGRAKLDAVMKRFSQLSPEAARVAQIYGPTSEKTPKGHLAEATKALQLMGADVATQRGLQNPEPVTNAAGRIINRKPMSGELSEAPVAGGGAESINPSSPVVAGAHERATGVAGQDVDRATQVSAGVQPATSAIRLSTEIDDLADQIDSGKIASLWKKRLADAGFTSDAIGARQLLEKDLGQLKTIASTGAGSDQRQGLIVSGYPEATSTSKTIHTAMDFLRGSFRQSLNRGKALIGYRKTHPDLSGFTGADDILTSQTDPLMHEFASLKSPAERTAFYARNFSSEIAARAFRNKVRAAAHHGLVDRGD